MAVDAARAKSLFLNASDLADPAERAAYLDRECGDDAELRAGSRRCSGPTTPRRYHQPAQKMRPSTPTRGDRRREPRKCRRRNPISIRHPSRSRPIIDTTARPERAHRRPLHAPAKNRRRRHGRGLGRQADRAGQAQGRPQAHQDRHGLARRCCNASSRSGRRWR